VPTAGTSSASTLTEVSQALILNINTGAWPAQPTPPVSTTPPSVTGTADVNGILAASSGEWDLNDLTFAYQWSADGAPIAGATSSTLLVTPALSAKSVTVTVTASTEGLPAGSATATPVTIRNIPAWNKSTVYDSGDRVIYNGKLFEALWWAQNQKPGDPYGAWQELAVTADGATAWSASRVFNTGDQAVYQGKVYKAQWWTRNQVPGDPYGPWKLVG
jgi:chitodextrinase